MASALPSPLIQLPNWLKALSYHLPEELEFLELSLLEVNYSLGWALIAQAAAKEALQVACYFL